MADQDRFSIEADVSFTPFWRRLPHFFIYPLQFGALMRTAGFALVGAVAVLLGPIFGVWLYRLLWLAFLKYAFVVVERTANGRFDEPNNLHGNEEGDIGQALRMAAIISLLVLQWYLFDRYAGDLGGWLGGALFTILLPGAIMIVATTHSFWHALNPLQMLFFIKTIGSPYLALCGLVFSLGESMGWLQGFMATHINSLLVLPLLFFVQFYFTLIVFHMMGYAIYQYHDKLGLHAEVSFDKAQEKIAPNKKAGDPFLARLATLMAEGREEEACKELREELRTNWERNDLHERYQKLLLATGKKEQALNHALDFIGKLVLEKKLLQALDLCEQGMKADPAFEPRNSDHIHELANAASLSNRPKLALDLMRGFDKRFPGHKHIPQVYLLSAKILDERYGKTEEAAKILRALQAKFPGDPAAREARNYLEVLAKLAAASPRSPSRA